MQLKQKTLSKIISFSGIGLHSGKPVVIKLCPANADEGIKFRYNNINIDATWVNGISSKLCTTIKYSDVQISTIEHLMSALSSLGISNLVIETSGNEMPILDGSAKDFFEKIKHTGLVEQQKPQKIIKICKKIIIKKDKKFITIEPNIKNNLEIDYTIDYEDQFIKLQKFLYIHNESNFSKIYKARTFCLHDDLEKIFSLGLGKGGSLDNAIIVSGKKILNQGGLRYQNEFVKHKVLDCIGDLYLAGRQIYGKIKTYQGSHELNLLLLKEIFKSRDNYKIF